MGSQWLYLHTIQKQILRNFFYTTVCIFNKQTKNASMSQDIFIVNMSTVVYFYSSMRHPAAEHKATIMYDFTSSQEKPKNFFLFICCVLKYPAV